MGFVKSSAASGGIGPAGLTSPRSEEVGMPNRGRAIHETRAVPVSYSQQTRPLTDRVNRSRVLASRPTHLNSAYGSEQAESIGQDPGGDCRQRGESGRNRRTEAVDDRSVWQYARYTSRIVREFNDISQPYSCLGVHRNQ